MSTEQILSPCDGRITRIQSTGKGFLVAIEGDDSEVVEVEGSFDPAVFPSQLVSEGDLIGVGAGVLEMFPGEQVDC